jgi:hypothetical protein
MLIASFAHTAHNYAASHQENLRLPKQTRSRVVCASYSLQSYRNPAALAK